MTPDQRKSLTKALSTLSLATAADLRQKIPAVPPLALGRFIRLQLFRAQRLFELAFPIQLAGERCSGPAVVMLADVLVCHLIAQFL